MLLGTGLLKVANQEYLTIEAAMDLSSPFCSKD